MRHCPPRPFYSFTVQRFKAGMGGGAVCMDESIGGRWTPTEAAALINILQLQAAFFALKSFTSEVNDTHIQLQVDNTTAVAYFNNLGGS